MEIETHTRRAQTIVNNNGWKMFCWRRPDEFFWSSNLHTISTTKLALWSSPQALVGGISAFSFHATALVRLSTPLGEKYAIYSFPSAPHFLLPIYRRVFIVCTILNRFFFPPRVCVDDPFTTMFSVNPISPRYCIIFIGRNVLFVFICSSRREVHWAFHFPKIVSIA